MNSALPIGIGRYFATTLPWPVFSWNSSTNLYSPAFKRVDRQRRLLARGNHLLLLQFTAFEFHCRLALVAHLEAEPLACRHLDQRRLEDAVAGNELERRDVVGEYRGGDENRDRDEHGATERRK